MDLAPMAAGLLAISLGRSHTYEDDHAMPAKGVAAYDARYIVVPFLSARNTGLEARYMALPSVRIRSGM